MKFIKNFNRDEKIDYGKSDIQILDCKDVLVEGCNGIIEYDNNLIVLSLSKKNVHIMGFDLQFFNYSHDGIEVSGDIRSISFEKKESEGK
ncbi:MAG: hypothetical protein GX346_01055 [Clostridiales bacterium]|nr:hypothetical protein [Clostridiales bacterium]